MLPPKLSAEADRDCATGDERRQPYGLLPGSCNDLNPTTRCHPRAVFCAFVRLHSKVLRVPGFAGRDGGGYGSFGSRGVHGDIQRVRVRAVGAPRATASNGGTRLDPWERTRPQRKNKI